MGLPCITYALKEAELLGIIENAKIKIKGMSTRTRVTVLQTPCQACLAAPPVVCRRLTRGSFKNGTMKMSEPFPMPTMRNIVA